VGRSRGRSVPATLAHATPTPEPTDSAHRPDPELRTTWQENSPFPPRPP
jgi:hypothetical protein